MPQDLTVRLDEPVGVDPRPEALEIVSTVWASGYDEPLGHGLIREALDIAAQHPRSALLIGVSALETGLKEYIRFRIPNSEILFEYLPSPPALSLTNDVIPALHKALGVDAQGFTVEATDIKFLKKWVSQRNQVAHGTKRTVKVDELIGFLKFVRILLYKLDVCRGHEWAQALTSDD